MTGEAVTEQKVSRLEAWVSHRWDGPSQMRAFLGKSLPRNVGWLQTLGSLLLLYLVIQVITGILLSLYYSPAPDQAYASVDYVRQELTFGWLIYSLHKCGTSFVLVTAFLHLIRSYFLAAYKKPRELVWCTGVLLGLVLLMLAFSGQLLPYDQKGYWAAVVGIQIASSTPLIGGAINDVMTGGFGDIGATTLSRFFIAHVCVLPLLLFVLVGLHLNLLQKAGSAGPLTGDPNPHHSFYPRQAAKDMVAATVGAAVLFLVAYLVQLEDSGPAAPETAEFLPRPEWYFFAHFELMKLFPSSLAVVGSFWVPTAVIGGVMLLPFLDRSPERAFARRKFMTVVGGLGVGVLLTLTGVGIAAEAAEAAERAAAAPETGDEPDPIARGRAIYQLEMHDCVTCHLVNEEGGDIGPDLSTAGRRLRVDFMKAMIRRPQTFDPDSEMPPFLGNEQELDLLVQYLQSLK